MAIAFKGLWVIASWGASKFQSLNLGYSRGGGFCLSAQFTTNLQLLYRFSQARRQLGIPKRMHGRNLPAKSQIPNRKSKIEKWHAAPSCFTEERSLLLRRSLLQFFNQHLAINLVQVRGHGIIFKTISQARPSARQQVKHLIHSPLP